MTKARSPRWIRLGLAGLAALFVAPAVADDRATFSARDLMTGTRVTAADCAKTPETVYVTADGRGTCIRYYRSRLGQGTSAIVYMPGSAIGPGPDGKPAPVPGYLTQSPYHVRVAADVWAERLGHPVLFFGRVGLHGSSGWHAHRRSRHEVAVTLKAVDAIRAQLGFDRVHVVGSSDAGLLAAALVAERAYVGCAVATSAPLDLRGFYKATNWPFRSSGWLAHYDPIDEAAAIAARRDTRLFVLTDPEDRLSPARHQTAFVEAVTRAGGKAMQIFTQGRGRERHGLTEKGLFLAGDCANGKSDTAIGKRFAETGPMDFGE